LEVGEGNGAVRGDWFSVGDSEARSARNTKINPEQIKIKVFQSIFRFIYLPIGWPVTASTNNCRTIGTLGTPAPTSIAAVCLLAAPLATDAIICLTTDSLYIGTGRYTMSATGSPSALAPKG